MDGNTVDAATLTVPQLQEMNQAELDTLFRNSPAGPDPEWRGGWYCHRGAGLRALGTGC